MMKRKVCAALLLLALTAAAGCGNKESDIEPSGTSVPEENVTSQKNTAIPPQQAIMQMVKMDLRKCVCMIM